MTPAKVHDVGIEIFTRVKIVLCNSDGTTVQRLRFLELVQILIRFTQSVQRDSNFRIHVLVASFQDFFSRVVQSVHLTNVAVNLENAREVYLTLREREMVLS